MNINIVLVIIYRKVGSKYEFLLLKRTIEEGGFWQPPGGRVELEDKSKLEAAFREAKEEAGLDKENIVKVIENVHSFTITKHYLTNEPIEPVMEDIFAFEVKNSWLPRIDLDVELEHDEFRWVSFDDALKLLKWQDNKDAFNKLKKLLN